MSDLKTNVSFNAESETPRLTEIEEPYFGLAGGVPARYLPEYTQFVAKNARSVSRIIRNLGAPVTNLEITIDYGSAEEKAAAWTQINTNRDTGELYESVIQRARNFPTDWLKIREPNQIYPVFMQEQQALNQLKERDKETFNKLVKYIGRARVTIPIHQSFFPKGDFLNLSGYSYIVTISDGGNLLELDLMKVSIRDAIDQGVPYNNSDPFLED